MIPLTISIQTPTPNPHIMVGEVGAYGPDFPNKI